MQRKVTACHGFATETIKARQLKDKRGFFGGHRGHSGRLLLRPLQIYSIKSWQIKRSQFLIF